MERGSKYGEGSRGNLKLWQSQKSGMDSFLYRVDENMTASTYSLNKIPERNLESMSSHSAHSIPLYLMPRPNSVAGESLSLSPSLNCESFLKKGICPGSQKYGYLQANDHAAYKFCQAREPFLAKLD